MSCIAVHNESLHDALQKYTRTENERSDNAYYNFVGYMDRLSDRERPIAASSPIFINPPRPDPALSRNNTTTPNLEGKKTKSVWKRRKVQTESEKEAIRKVYQQSIQKPAGTTYTATELRRMTNENDSGIATIIPGRAWVIPDIFSEDDCDVIISFGERCGIKRPSKTSYRTSKRSENLIVPELSVLTKTKFVNSSTPILDLVEASRPYTAVRGVHTNWRVGMYEPTGENSFYPHQDQADVVTVNENAEDGALRKNFYSSTHTLLIALTEPGVDFMGGATRFFPTGQYDDGSTIDVFLPKGYALIFEQKGLLHAGLPVDKLTTGDNSDEVKDSCFEKKKGAKYIAQAGILRAEGDHMHREPEARFKPGPGFDPSL